MFKRHSLVWLNDDGWQNASFCNHEQHRPIVERWQENRWPLIVRRRDADAAGDEICLGIACPPDASGNKLRLPIRAKSQGLHAIREPLHLAEILSHVSAHWSGTLEQLRQDAKQEGLTIRVYGSLALQALTGQTYLREASDIDLLLAPRDRYQFEQGLELLQKYQRALPLDGEIELPDGGAVAWKEWLQIKGARGQRVLMKRATDVALIKTDDLLAQLGNYTCSA